MVNGHEYAQVNKRVCLGPIDSKDEPLPVMWFLPVLQGPLPTLNLIAKGDLSSYIMFWVRQE